MAVLTRAAWDTIVNQLIDSGGTPRISAADARTVLDDLGDSVVFKDEIIDVIDDMLGGNTWQTGGGGGGGGVSLAQVFNAIRTAGTVNGIELAKEVSGSVLTLTLQMVAVGAHGRYAAIIDNTNRDPTEFTAAIFGASGAVMANSDTIAAPAYAGSSTFVSLGFATPSRSHRRAGRRQCAGAEYPFLLFASRRGHRRHHHEFQAKARTTSMPAI